MLLFRWLEIVPRSFAKAVSWHPVMSVDCIVLATSFASGNAGVLRPIAAGRSGEAMARVA